MSGAPERAIGDRESGGADDMRLDPEARAKPQNGAGILRNIGLIKGDRHGQGKAAAGQYRAG